MRNCECHFLNQSYYDWTFFNHSFDTFRGICHAILCYSAFTWGFLSSINMRLIDKNSFFFIKINFWRVEVIQSFASNYHFFIQFQNITTVYGKLVHDKIFLSKNKPVPFKNIWYIGRGSLNVFGEFQNCVSWLNMAVLKLTEIVSLRRRCWKHFRWELIYIPTWFNDMIIITH